MRRFGRLRDRDELDAAFLYALVAVSGGIGLIFGAGLGLLLYGSLLRGALLFGPPLAILCFAIAYVVVDRASAFAKGLHAPSGESTPRRYELSREEALLVAGRFEEAAEALVEVGERHPEDPRPRQMLAELYRDELEDYEQAAGWYRRAAAVPGISVDTERMLLRELIELCRDRMRRPELAAPALARTAELHPDDRLGHWARTQLREIKGGGTGPSESPPGPDPLGDDTRV